MKYLYRKNVQIPQVTKPKRKPSKYTSCSVAFSVQTFMKTGCKNTMVTIVKATIVMSV